MTNILPMSAQMISGVITDSEYKDPLPAVRVSYVEGKRTQTISDTDGRFRIPARRGQLLFSIIGYDTQIVEVTGKTQRLNVTMRANAEALKEVEVIKQRKRYSRKDNPAVEMMRKVIAAKKSYDLYQSDFFSYRKYEKMTLSLNEVTEDLFESGHFKHFPFVKDHVEVCPETGKPILPLTVDEKISRQIYRKDPKTEKTIVEGTRSEGVTSMFTTGDIVNKMMAECFTDVDIYKDEVRLLQYPFTSPISTTSAIRFYRFFIQDTLLVDEDKCYRIDFTPNNQQDFGFSGSLFIMADSTWRVKRAELHIPPRSDVNFVDDMELIQQFTSMPSGEQVLTDSKMILQLKIVDWAAKAQVERELHYSNFEFNPIAEREFKIKGDTKVEYAARNRDEAYWEGVRPVPLTHSQSQIEAFVQHIQEIKGVKYILWVAKAFIENYIETTIKPGRPNKVDIGPVNTMIGSNWVEGFRLRVSAQTSANLNKHWFAKGFAKYGFGDHRWKGMGELTYSFNAKDYLPREFPCRTITFTYINDVVSPSDKFVPTDPDNVFVSWKWAPVRHMNYYERYNLAYVWEVENGLRFEGQLRREWNEGAGQMFYRSLNQSDPALFQSIKDLRADGNNLNRITFTEASVGVSFQPGATYVNTKQHRLPTNYDTPVMGITHTIGFSGVWGSQYRYNFTEANLYKRFWLRSWGKMDVELKGGVQWNKVPYPFLIMPAANMSYIIQDHTFNLINNMEFLNDRYASMLFSWDMNGKIFNRIPLIKKLKWREYLGCNMLWGKLTDKNNPFLAQNAGDAQLFYFPGYYKNGQFKYVSHVMDQRKPYVELIFGIHNIFKLVHLEYVHRINYIYPGTQRWGIRILFRATF